MREYMRQKRWRELERLQASSLDISISRGKRPIQRLKPDIVQVRASSQMQYSRKPGKEAKSRTTSPQQVSVGRGNEAGECSATQGIGSLGDIEVQGFDKDLATSPSVTSRDVGESSSCERRMLEEHALMNLDS